MNRRTFLKALASTIAAAAAAPSLTALAPNGPPIDWTGVFNAVELKWEPFGPTIRTRLHVNGHEYTDPAVWEQVRKIVHINHEEGWIAFAASGLMDDASASGFRWRPATSEMPTHGVLSFNVQVMDRLQTSFDDFWVGDGRGGCTALDGVRGNCTIEVVTPQPYDESAGWVAVEED